MANLSQETVQKILDTNDIVDLVQTYFPLKRSGAAFVALCPFHNENTPSFQVNPQRQIFHCFGCHVGGDAIKFVMLYENLSFVDAAKKLADRGGVIVEEEAYDPEEDAKRRLRSDLVRMQKSAATWFHHHLFKSSLAQPARDYLKTRNLSMETSRRWEFGYAPSDSKLFLQWARGQGFTDLQLVNGGLAKWADENRPGRGIYPFFRNRLMFPVNNDRGETVGFSGRVLSSDQSGGKYVNSPETPLFTKSRLLFGFDRSKRAILRAKRAILFEGQLDVISVFEAGIENLVAPLGTAFTSDQAKLLRRFTEEVILCFDSDNAGREAASKAFRVLAPMGILVRLAMLPPGEDPDSLLRKSGRDTLRQVIEEAPEFFDFQIDRRGGQLERDDLRERLTFARTLAADVALVSEKMLQDSLINRIAVRLAVGEDEIRKHVADAVRQQARAEAATRRRSGLQAQRDQQTTESEIAGESPTPADPPEVVTMQNRAVRLLCRGLLTNPEVKVGLSAQLVPDFLRNLPETELLARLWKEEFDPAAISSVNALFSRLSEPAQAALRFLLAENVETMSMEVAQDCLSALKRQSIQREMDAIKARMSAPNLPDGEALRLTKVLLDLRKQLNEC